MPWRREQYQEQHEVIVIILGELCSICQVGVK
jgi:hypothetical protein